MVLLNPWFILGAMMLLTPILGVVLEMIKNVLQSQERRLQMKLDAKNAEAGPSESVVVDLKDEIAALRDTTTQHAISLQHSIERLEHRVDFLEQKTTAMESARPQMVGRS